MTVGKISIVCWTIFVVMSVAFLPVGASASPAAAHFGELEKLGQLHSQGILTDEEFAAEKARLLGE